MSFATFPTLAADYLNADGARTIILCLVEKTAARFEGQAASLAVLSEYWLQPNLVLDSLFPAKLSPVASTSACSLEPHLYVEPALFALSNEKNHQIRKYVHSIAVQKMETTALGL